MQNTNFEIQILKPKINTELNVYDNQLFFALVNLFKNNQPELRKSQMTYFQIALM